MVRRLRAAAGTRAGETVEPQVWEESRAFPGGFTIDDKGPALETARSWGAVGTILTDGSRLDSGMRLADRRGVDGQAFPPGHQQGGL